MPPLPPDKDTLRALQSAYRGLPVSAHKQLGTRALRDAAALGYRNPIEAAHLLARAAFHLPYARGTKFSSGGPNIDRDYQRPP